MIIDDIFDLVNYKFDSASHILLNSELCKDCLHKACTFVCPARCYQWNSEKERMDFAYEACLECGTCLIICDKKALEWN
ncbi:MAG: 4Fe-4S dicluster domain-containing protein, partial [Candidatus Goldbacteria bacterium]|nr:4Fe-4S dicluster domain-containing protein [Candidatus Goldiibacteriota bacterium]